ncbi:hypothetical protein I7I53_01634 [Histoplasma capsulatum var. duboisii H88]|uniref:Uncharacterized protein n=1 Tax=Ajellomyces capsulatus (strain H88) TaxID=544711 RepID=A0A8A1LJX8_AJEC8|nr:hypothetical protein I7I53_01634 [Histoplasma capsulatum var. duboisii H88]
MTDSCRVKTSSCRELCELTTDRPLQEKENEDLELLNLALMTFSLFSSFFLHFFVLTRMMVAEVHGTAHPMVQYIMEGESGFAPKRRHEGRHTYTGAVYT